MRKLGAAFEVLVKQLAKWKATLETTVSAMRTCTQVDFAIFCSQTIGGAAACRLVVMSFAQL